MKKCNLSWFCRNSISAHENRAGKLAVSFFRFLVLVSVSLVGTSYKCSDRSKDGNYPIPADVQNVLFYIQRSIDSNVVVYQLNTDAHGNPDTARPIKPFWIKYTEGGKHEDLTPVQDKFSYGVKLVSYDRMKQSFVFHFAGYDKRVFMLSKSVIDQQYHVYTFISNYYGEVGNIYINITGGSFWLPTIEHVDLIGANPINHGVLKEVIKP